MPLWFLSFSFHTCGGWVGLDITHYVIWAFHQYFDLSNGFMFSHRILKDKAGSNRYGMIYENCYLHSLGKMIGDQHRILPWTQWTPVIWKKPKKKILQNRWIKHSHLLSLWGSYCQGQQSQLMNILSMCWPLLPDTNNNFFWHTWLWSFMRLKTDFLLHGFLSHQPLWALTEPRDKILSDCHH